MASVGGLSHIVARGSRAKATIDSVVPTLGLGIQRPSASSAIGHLGSNWTLVVQTSEPDVAVAALGAVDPLLEDTGARAQGVGEPVSTVYSSDSGALILSLEFSLDRGVSPLEVRALEQLLYDEFKRRFRHELGLAYFFDRQVSLLDSDAGIVEMTVIFTVPAARRLIVLDEVKTLIASLSGLSQERLEGAALAGRLPGLDAVDGWSAAVVHHLAAGRSLTEIGVEPAPKPSVDGLRRLVDQLGETEIGVR